MKRLIKKILTLLAAFFSSTCLSGCMLGAAALAVYIIGEEKEFSSDGMTITLTDRFERVESSTQTCCYASSILGILALKEGFAETSGSSEWTLEAYAEKFIQDNDLDVQYEVSQEGYIYLEYKKKMEGDNYTHLATFHKTEDAFWVIQFFTHSKNYNLLEKNILGYADSIIFDAGTQMIPD